MAIQPTQPQGIGGVLDTTFQLYKSSLGSVWPLCLLMSLAGLPPSIYVGMSRSATAIADPTAMLAAMTDPVYWLVYAASLAVMMAIIGALYLKQNAIGSDGDMSLGTALQGGFSRIVTLILMTIGFVIAFVIGSILLVIPGLILLVSLMLATSLAMFEGKGPVDSLIGSHKLVWGNWWRTFVILSIGGILVFVIYMAVALVIGVITPFIGLGMDDLLMYSLVSGMLIGLFMNILVTPFFSALLIAVYWDLKLRKEGGDLAARVGALNAA
jgi:hypothetical protein